MTKTTDALIDKLENNSTIFSELFSNVPEEELHFKPSPEKWNLLEVACHLLDEEREDFRARLKFVLDQTEGPMPKIDPPAWVTERNYAAQNFHDVLRLLREERSASVDWLRSLENPDWELFYMHPRPIKITGIMLLTNWVAHDYLHFRQITGLKFAFLKQFTGDDLGYAGSW